jgi:hypothetical protein
VPISELVFGALTQNRSSLEPSLGFAVITLLLDLPSLPARRVFRTVVPLLLILRRRREAGPALKKLFEKYDADGGAFWLYRRALVAFRENEGSAPSLSPAPPTLPGDQFDPAIRPSSCLVSSVAFAIA